MNNLARTGIEQLTIERCWNLLVEAKTVDEVLDVHDGALAFALYLRSKHAGEGMRADVEDFLVDVKVKLGRLEREMPKAKGGQPCQRSPTDSKKESVEKPTKTLAERGVDPKLSAESQELAAIADDCPEAIADAKAEARKKRKRVQTKRIAVIAQTKKLARTGESLKDFDRRVAALCKEGYSVRQIREHLGLAVTASQVTASKKRLGIKRNAPSVYEKLTGWLRSTVFELERLSAKKMLRDAPSECRGELRRLLSRMKTLSEQLHNHVA